MFACKLQIIKQYLPPNYTSKCLLTKLQIINQYCYKVILKTILLSVNK